MWKYIVTLAAVIAGAFMLLPREGNTPAPNPETVTPASELRMKEATLNQDVALTGVLCRSQCSTELRRNAQAMSGKSGDEQRKTMEAVRAQHPHMERLYWTRRGEPLDRATAIGSLKEEVSKAAAPMLTEAKRRADNGQTYQSDTFQADGGSYFVLTEPSGDGEHAMIGIVRQHILQQVADHQKKNLRIVTYPAEGNYKIESVDSRTLRDVHADHPEENEGTSHYHKNQIVVKFKKQPTQAEIDRIRQDIDATHMKKLGYTYVFESNKLEAKQLMNYFRAHNVEYAEPHFLYLTNEKPVRLAQDNPNTVVPNDSLYQRYQWNLPLIETEAGWNVSKGSSDVTVAVIDTGVDLNHPDLRDQLASGTNVVNPDTAPNDDVGHGTHVAGVIGALVNNHLGVAGMNWYSRIMPVKVLDSSGAGSTYAVAQGIIWAVDNGAKVINMSLGNYADAEFLHEAIKYAYDRDVVLIAASGNDNTETPGYPAAYPEVFAVAATDAQRNKAPFSNYGDYIDVAAPGVSIASTYPGSQYAALSGTSMASPHVTALAALIRSVNPQLSNKEVMQIMRNTATDLGPQGKDKYYGFGQIDVARALEAARKGSLSEEKAVETNNDRAEDRRGSLIRLLERLLGY